MKQEVKVLDNAIEAGYLYCWQKKHPNKLRLIPYKDSARNKVVFRAEGAITEALGDLYDNRPVGSLDILEAIRSVRSIIFSLK